MNKIRSHVALFVLSFILPFFSCEKFGRILRVDTGEASDITATSAQIEAFIIDVGESGLSEYGWHISLNNEPTISGMKISNGAKDSYGQYSNIVKGLEPATKYFVLPYIIGGGTTVYGEVLELETKELEFSMSFPTTNSHLQAGLTYNITWTANFNDNLKIVLYKNDILKQIVGAEIENDGTYSWLVGSNNETGDDYKIIIFSMENLNIKAETPVFSIDN